MVKRSSSKKNKNSKKKSDNIIQFNDNNCMTLDIKIDFNRNINDKELLTLKNIINKKLSIKSGYKIFTYNSIMELYECFLHSVIKSYNSITKVKPHIITSRLDSPLLTKLLDFHKKNITISYTNLNINSTLNTKDMESKIIKGKTCLIIAPYVNNNTGMINNIKEITNIAHSYKIPVITNCSDVFSKCKINATQNDMDSFVIDLGKINGPRNIYMLYIKNSFYEGYYLEEYCNRFTNNIHNIDLISYEMSKKALQNSFKISNNKKNLNNKNYLVKELKKTANKCYFYEELVKKDLSVQEKDIIIFSDNSKCSNIVSFMVFSKNCKNIKTKLKQNNIHISNNINKEIFINIGIKDKWINKIFLLKINNLVTKKDIDKFIKILKNYI